MLPLFLYSFMLEFYAMGFGGALYSLTHSIIHSQLFLFVQNHYLTCSYLDVILKMKSIMVSMYLKYCTFYLTQSKKLVKIRSSAPLIKCSAGLATMYCTSIKKGLTSSQSNSLSPLKLVLISSSYACISFQAK